MEVGLLQRELADLTSGLLKDGILDRQFLQIQSLRDETVPDFPYEVVSLFFEDAQRLIKELGKALEQQQFVGFTQIDANVHQLKGGSSSIGAKRVTDVCVALRGFCEVGDMEGCYRCLQQLKLEYCLVKNKLERLFSLEKQILAAGGSLPVVET